MDLQDGTEAASSPKVGRRVPLTEVVHKALMALGKATAILPEERLKDHSPDWPLPDSGLGRAYKNAALLLLVGIVRPSLLFAHLLSLNKFQEFEMESDFEQLMERGIKDEKGPPSTKLMEMLGSLAAGGTGPHALARAQAVYYKELEGKTSDVNGSTWKHLKEVTMERLSRNVQSLIWSKITWVCALRPVTQRCV